MAGMMWIDTSENPQRDASASEHGQNSVSGSIGANANFLRELKRFGDVEETAAILMQLEELGLPGDLSSVIAYIRVQKRLSVPDLPSYDIVNEAERVREQLKAMGIQPWGHETRKGIEKRFAPSAKLVKCYSPEGLDDDITTGCLREFAIMVIPCSFQGADGSSIIQNPSDPVVKRQFTNIFLLPKDSANLVTTAASQILRFMTSPVLRYQQDRTMRVHDPGPYVDRLAAAGINAEGPDDNEKVLEQGSYLNRLVPILDDLVGTDDKRVYWALNGGGAQIDNRGDHFMDEPVNRVLPLDQELDLAVDIPMQESELREAFVDRVLVDFVDSVERYLHNHEDVDVADVVDYLCGKSVDEQTADEILNVLEHCAFPMEVGEARDPYVLACQSDDHNACRGITIQRIERGQDGTIKRHRIVDLGFSLDRDERIEAETSGEGMYPVLDQALNQQSNFAISRARARLFVDGRARAYLTYGLCNNKEIYSLAFVKHMHRRSGEGNPGIHNVFDTGDSIYLNLAASDVLGFRKADARWMLNKFRDAIFDIRRPAYGEPIIMGWNRNMFVPSSDSDGRPIIEPLFDNAVWGKIESDLRHIDFTTLGELEGIELTNARQGALQLVEAMARIAEEAYVGNNHYMTRQCLKALVRMERHFNIGEIVRNLWPQQYERIEQLEGSIPLYKNETISLPGFGFLHPQAIEILRENTDSNFRPLFSTYLRERVKIVMQARRQ